MKNGICATGKLQWVFAFCLASIGMVLMICNAITTTLGQRIIYALVFVFVTGCFLFHLSHSTYLCNTGIEQYYFGKLHSTLSWEDIHQVCIMKLLPFSMGVSAPSYILIVPTGCEKYSQDKWFGLKYLIHFRHRVYRIDDSSRNRRYINQVYGKLDIQS